MNAKDFIQLLEYSKTFGAKEKKSRRPKKELDLRDIDPIALLQAEHRRAKDYEKFLEEFVKLHKKEEKKEDDKKKKEEHAGSVLHLAFVLMALSPITGILYAWMLAKVFGLH